MTSNTVIETPEVKTTERVSKVENEKNNVVIPKMSFFQLLNLCIGFIGIQFAWSMQIGLSSRVTEPLGASPFIFGLIWCAGPITGLLVQPIVGAISDSIWTRFGRRRPFLMAGAIFGALSLVAFPNSGKIAAFFESAFNSTFPVWSGLLIAAILIWIIDACVNVSQGPYRALVPDVTPPEQHAMANSLMSFAIGLGSVIAFGAAPLIEKFTGYQLSITAQYLMASVALVLAITWTCITIKEYKRTYNHDGAEKVGMFESLRGFTKASPEVYKLCAVQFFTWLGLMSMFIYFNNFMVHNVYQIPDLTHASPAVHAQFKALEMQASNYTGWAFAAFNLVCFLVSIPLGLLCSKFGKKNIHSTALTIMGLAFLSTMFIGSTNNPNGMLIMMAFAGIGWASILALPFALLSEHINHGQEGSIMGIFNMFVAGPQLISALGLGWLIEHSPMMTNNGMSNHWEYAFIVGGISIIAAAVITQTVKERYKEIR